MHQRAASEPQASYVADKESATAAAPLANHSAAAVAQRKLSNVIDTSPRQALQRRAVDALQMLSLGDVAMPASAQSAMPVQRVEQSTLVTGQDDKLGRLIDAAYRLVIPWLEEASGEEAPYAAKAANLLKNLTSGVEYYAAQSSAPSEPMATLTLTLSRLINYTVSQLNAEIDKATKGDIAAPPKGYVSPYAAGIDKYDGALGGAVVRVEKNFVVVVEHYQLKHNPDLGILTAGGAFAGKSGSQLAGGWAAHTNTYSAEVLAAAKLAIAGLTKVPGAPITLAKQRLASIDAYVSISRDGLDWVINYHGNPPE